MPCVNFDRIKRASRQAVKLYMSSTKRKENNQPSFLWHSFLSCCIRLIFILIKISRCFLPFWNEMLKFEDIAKFTTFYEL